MLAGTVVGFYLLSVMLLHVPAVQRGVAFLISEALEDVLHTELSIGRVDLGYFNRIILDDVLIKDQKGKDLLRATRLSAKMELASLLHGKISVSNVQLYGFDIRLYQRTPKEKPNFRFLMDAFSKKDSLPSNPNLRVNSVLIRRGKLSWHRFYKPLMPGRFNPDHIVLDKISTTLSLKCYTADSLNLTVKKLAFEEYSGLQLEQLSFKITANQEKALLDHFTVELPHSRLVLHPVTMRYHHIKERDGKGRYQDFTFHGSIEKGTFSFSDFLPLYPKQPQNHVLEKLQPLSVEARFNGSLEQVLIDQLTLHTSDRSIVFDSQLAIRQLRNPAQRTIKADIRNLQVTSDGLKQLAEWASNNKVSIPPYLQAVGTLKANGFLSYSSRLLRSDLNIYTDLGSLILSGSVSNGNGIEAEVHTSGFKFGKLTGREEQFGETAFDLSCKGLLHSGAYPALSLQGTIGNLSYNHYDYHDISVDVDYRKGGFVGNVTIDDPHLALTARGKFNLHSSTPYIKAGVSVRRFAPHALALTSRYAETEFQGNIQADFRGGNFENMEGFIRLDGFHMSMPEEDYTTGPIWFKATHEPGKRNFSLHSDFLQAEMEGDFRIGTLIARCRKLLHTYIPSFVKEPQLKKNVSDEVTLSMHINHTKPIEKIFGIPLRIPQAGHIDSYFNSLTEELDFNASIPSFNYNGQQLDDVRILAGRVNDSITCTVDFKKQIGKAPVDFRLLARATHDDVYTGLNWTNHAEKNYQGSISANTRFSRNEENKMLTDIEFHPSQIIVNDSVWNVRASGIHVAPGSVSINRFAIEQGDRHLILNGRVSGNPEDSLTVDLKDINLEYIFNIVNFHTVDFAGQATGRIYAANLMKSPEVEAYLHVQNFTFNQAYLGEMNLHGGWEKEKNAISLHARMADPANRSMTSVDGDVKIGAAPKGGLDLMIRTENINLAFLNHYTNGIFTDLHGRASGWVRVFNPFKSVNLEGDMLVSDGGMRVDATEVDYRLVNDSVILRPDNIYFRNAIIYDRQSAPGKDGHYAVVNGVLRHSNLSRLRFNFDIDAYNILGYDVKDFGDNVFCGTAYATGKIGFSGQPGDLNINIDASPEENTVFVYNQSSPTTLTDNQFITYKVHRDSISGHSSSPNGTPSPTPESDMRINFRLNLTPKATMKILMDPKAGDYIALNGHGNIRANYYNKGDFTMYGTYTINQGIYKLSLQDVIHKDFVFNPGGTIVFGGLPVQADLNLQAVYTVPSVSLNDLSARSTFSRDNVRVNCLMNLGGKAQSPQVSFDFDLPNVNEDEKQMVRSLISTEEEKNMQVIYLLGIGRFYTYDYNNTDQSQSSVAMKSLLSSTLSGQLNQIFSSLLGNNSNWNFGTNLSTGETGWSDMDVEGLLSGRLLNNRLLINGNFGYRDNNANPNGNFIGDFDLQWLLTPSGSVSLKAYSKTNDRYFTKSSLTTQGVGIGLKRDFNTWRDVFRVPVPKKRGTTP